MSDAHNMPAAKKTGFFHVLLTEDDFNRVWCPVRIFGASGMAGEFLGAGYNLVMHGAFDALAFGSGIAAVIGATAAGVGIKAKWGG